MKIKPATIKKYEWFLSCARKNEPRPLPAQRVPMCEDGQTAIVCFHTYESTGKIPPCREPELLERYLAGKAWHGVTIANCAEDFIGRILFSAEIKANYPSWVADEIFCQAEKLCREKHGFVLKFVKNRRDYSELTELPADIKHWPMP